MEVWVLRMQEYVKAEFDGKVAVRSYVDDDSARDAVCDVAVDVLRLRGKTVTGEPEIIAYYSRGYDRVYCVKVDAK